MRKYLISLLCGLVASVSLAGDPISLEVYGPLTGTGSICVLPPKGTVYVPAWINAANVVAGSLWVADNGRTHMIVRPGLTVASPTNIVSAITTSNQCGVTTLPVSGTQNLRLGLNIDNTSTSHVYVSVGTPAVAGAGIHLVPLTGSFQISGAGVPQAAIFAISGTTGAVLTVQEW